MAPPKKFYTVACENKFAAFDQEDHVSSDDEVVFVKAPPPKDETSSASRQHLARGSNSENQRKTGNESPLGRGGRGASRGGYDSVGRGGRGENGSYKSVRNIERSGDSSTRGAYRGGRGGVERDGRAGFRRDEGNWNGKRKTEGDGEFSSQDSIDGMASRKPIGAAAHNGGQFRHGGNTYRGFYRGGAKQESGYRGNARQFDRHSGTGRGRDLKKRGGGGYNWGNEGIDFGADQEISPLASRAAVEGEQSTDLGSKDSLDATPKTDDERPKSNGVNGEHADETEEKIEAKEKKTDLIDLNEYKRLQEAKRANLPCFSKSEKAATSSTIDTQKEMEDEGYERYVKENSDDEEEDADDETGRPDNDDDSGKRKKKTLNFFEYIHQEGGRLRLFPGYRGRGRGRGKVSPGGFQRDEGEKGGEYSKPRGAARSPRRYHDSRTGKRRDAPDLEDTRAFPTLA